MTIVFVISEKWCLGLYTIVFVTGIVFKSKNGGCEKRIVPKKERPRVYNELKVFLSVIINLQ